MSAEERATADALFDELVAAAKAEREEMKAKAESLSSSSSSSSPSSPSSSPSSLSPLDSPFLLGDFDVAYVSTGGKQKGQPAGGRFRSGFGRALFATTAVCQSIFFSENEGNENGEKVDEENKGAEKPPLFVTNKVAFRLAGLVEGSVGLHGRVTRAFPSSDWKRAEEAREGEGEEEEKKGEEEEEILDAVRVDFDPAVVSLLPRSRLFGLFLRIGRPSWVALATPYGELELKSLFFPFWSLEVERRRKKKLTEKKNSKKLNFSTTTTTKNTLSVDDRVRLGVGSLGSKFLFVRGGEAERQGMRRAGLISESKNGNGSEKTGLGAKLALLSLAAGLLCASFALLLSAWGSGAACWTAVSSSGRSLGGGSGRLLLSVARDAARSAAALGAALVCGRFALGVLSAARGGKGSKKGEQERVGPGGREVVAASSSSS